MTKILPALALLAAAASASAQLVYEPFNYTSSILDGQVNPGNGLPWSKMAFDPDVEDNIAVNNSNLGFSGLAPATGRSVTYGGEGASERLGLGQNFNSGTYYYSLVFQVTSPLTSNPAFIAGFSNASGSSEIEPGSVGTRLYLKQGPSSTQQNPTFRIGVSKNSSVDTTEVSHISYLNTEFGLNAPIMVVGSYSIVGATHGTDDEAKLWVNPHVNTFGAAAAPAPTLTAPLAANDLANSDATQSQLGAFVLRQASASVPNVQVDELRIDRTWAQVTPPVGTSWNFSGGGLWSEDGKWSTLARPNSSIAFVNFGSAASSATITVDNTYALRTINFTGSGPYMLNGAGTLNFSASAAVNVMAGSHTIASNVNLGGDLHASVRSGSTLTLSNVTVNGNSLLKSGAGTLQLANARANNLEIISGIVRIAPAGTLDAVSKINALSLNSAGATLDLTNNDMVIDYTGASPLGTRNGTTYTGILGAIQSGRNGGAWNGAGIMTSQSSAGAGLPRTTLGVAEASMLLGLSGAATAIWRGQSVDATSLLIKYTYSGDANLDGRIDADDYFILNSNYNRSASVFGYANGDFDYNGVINGDDFFIIDANFIAQGAPVGAALLSESISSVPEPAGVALAALAAMGMIRRRRGYRCA